MTDTIPSSEQIIKSDARGRMQTPPARREALLDEFERSGLSAMKFAALVGIKYQTFANWAQKRRRGAVSNGTGIAAKDQSVRWLEAVVQQAQGSTAESGPVLKLVLPGGASVEISDRNQVALAAALLHALERPVGAC
jgi:hypothetical protein